VFFRQNTRYSILFFLYLCLFIMGFALLTFFLFKIFKYLKDNEYICKTVQKKQASSPRLGTGRIFVDRTGPVGLAFSTRPNRPVEILDLTVKNRLVQIQHWTGETPVRLIYQKGCFISSDSILIFFLSLPYSIVEIYWIYIFEK